MPPPISAAAPIAPMLARLARALPEGDYLYEPKWDGFRAIAHARDGRGDLRSRHARPLARHFPEVAAAIAPLGRAVLDGEIGVMGRGGLDFPALLARIHPAASRVERLAAEDPLVSARVAPRSARARAAPPPRRPLLRGGAGPPARASGEGRRRADRTIDMIPHPWFVLPSCSR
jgi:hypothetical protein